MIYQQYRDYMTQKYGPGPWTQERYPNLSPWDRFPVWKRLNRYEEPHDRKILMEVYLSSLGRTGKRGRSSKSGRKRVSRPKPERWYRRFGG